jgi:hypothetical protein
MIKFPFQVQLMNGKQVELTEPEFDDFISDVMVPNPQWQHSGLLDKDEVERYHKGEATVQDLHKIIRYILVYQENLSLTTYLFLKVNDLKNAEKSKEYNLPYLSRLQGLRAIGNTDIQKLLNMIAQKMEKICTEMGSDPL